VVPREIVVQRRDLLGAEVAYLDVELHRPASQLPIGMLRRVRHPQRKTCPAMLANQLPLQREGKAAAPSFEQDPLSAHRLLPFAPAGHVHGDDVARFHGRTVLDRAELCDRLAEVLEDAPHLLVGDLGRRTADFDPAHLGERDDRAHVDGRRVAQRLARRESVRVDVRVPTIARPWRSTAR
jgi:hypothetical protein